MAYIALYRKYRSQSFSELMGQESVTTTLRNAVASGRFGHAYLFYGARGCGKTSTARLLARALNCENGPTPDPCGVCRICQAIKEGSCMDVVEMDAASETGIDDVREKVIENVQYAPGEARFKVYIIDEVHDLSSKAFDALLKTVEEPPAHVVFILATTEFHKVPITIRSRCQCFAFRRGSLQDLSLAVKKVLEAENHTAEPEAILAIARAAEGSWRDSLSLLEQVMVYSDGHISQQTVQQAIGVVGTPDLMETLDVLASGDLQGVFSLAGKLSAKGVETAQLMSALQGHLRDLALLSAGAKQAADQEMGVERAEILLPQAQQFKSATLLAMMGDLAAAERELRFSNHHRWILERTLARLQAIAQNIQIESAPVRVSEAPTVIIPKPPALDAASRNPAPAPIPAAQQRGVQNRQAEKAAEEEAVSDQDAKSRFQDNDPLGELRRSWKHVVELVRKRSPSGANFLMESEVNKFEGNSVHLLFKDKFACARIQEKGRSMVETVLTEYLHRGQIRIHCSMSPEQTGENVQTADISPVKSIMNFDASASPAEVSIPDTSSESAPTGLLEETLEIFGGAVVKSEKRTRKQK